MSMETFGKNQMVIYCRRMSVKVQVKMLNGKVMMAFNHNREHHLYLCVNMSSSKITITKIHPVGGKSRL